jgi:predicted ArsR family transcriptional regulator
VSEGCDDAEVLRLVEDEYARAILLETSRRPMSASDLADALDASPPTIYRRVDDLTRCGLLDEATKFADGGHNYSVYAARVEAVTVSFTDGELTVSLTDREAVGTDETTAERFTRLYEALR